ncbi:MAG: ArsR/SmtB family transcription factor [Bacillaceae bacterium]
MDEKIKKMSHLLKLVSDSTRLTILAYLKQKEHCVCEFVEILNISQPGVSQQLRKLKKEKIVLERREGIWSHYRLNPVQEPYIQRVIDDLPEVDITKLNSCKLNSLKKELE